MKVFSYDLQGSYLIQSSFRSHSNIESILLAEMRGEKKKVKSNSGVRRKSSSSSSPCEK